MIMVLLYEHRRRRVAEVAARTSMSELMHMNRIATAGELSASIAHEVNQPLTGISARASAAARWLAKEPPDIEKVRNMLREIINASDRAAEVVGSVRAMFKKDSKERPAVDINKLIRTVLEIVRVELQKNGVELQTALDEGLPRVECDPVQLQQVILNLVDECDRSDADGGASAPAHRVEVRRASQRPCPGPGYRQRGRSDASRSDFPALGHDQGARHGNGTSRSAARSSRAITDASGSRPRLRAARSFNSNCRPRRMRKQGRFRAALPSC